MLQVHKIMEKHWEFVWKLFCRLGILPVGGFLTLHCDTERFFSAAYPASWFVLFLEKIQDVISNASFLLPWFIYLSKILCMHRWYILVPNKFHDNHWKDSEKWWSEVLHKERFICILISRLISIIFLSTFVLNILSLCQLFCDSETFSMSLFGHFQFWAPTRFPKVICPRYRPGGIISLIWTAPQCDLEKWV